MGDWLEEISPLSRVSSKRGDGGLEIKHIPSVSRFKRGRGWRTHVVAAVGCVVVAMGVRSQPWSKWC